MMLDVAKVMTSWRCLPWRRAAFLQAVEASGLTMSQALDEAVDDWITKQARRRRRG